MNVQISAFNQEFKAFYDMKLREAEKIMEKSNKIKAIQDELKVTKPLFQVKPCSEEVFFFSFFFFVFCFVFVFVFV